MEEEIDRRRRDEGKKMTSTTVVLNRRLVAASAMEGELRRGRGWSVWSGGRDCARGDVAGRWRARMEYTRRRLGRGWFWLWWGLSRARFELAVGLEM